VSQMADDEKKGEDDMGVEVGRFETLEKEFQDVRARPASSTRARPAGGHAGRAAAAHPAPPRRGYRLRGRDLQPPCVHSYPALRPTGPLSPLGTTPLRAALRPAQVLQELGADPSLEKFKKEYEKLHRALRKSHGAQSAPPAACSGQVKTGCV